MQTFVRNQGNTDSTLPCSKLTHCCTCKLKSAWNQWIHSGDSSDTTIHTLPFSCNAQIAFSLSLSREILKSTIRTFGFKTIPSILAYSFSGCWSRPDIKYWNPSHFRISSSDKQEWNNLISSFPYLWLRKLTLLLYKKKERDSFENDWTLLAKSKLNALLSRWHFKTFAIR